VNRSAQLGLQLLDDCRLVNLRLEKRFEPDSFEVVLLDLRLHFFLMRDPNTSFESRYLFDERLVD
jgi:hypothetical protein